MFGLSEEVVGKISNVFAKHPAIFEARVYGSRAKGNYKPGSDIDIVIIAPSMKLEELLKIESELDDLFLPYKIDLSLFHQIDSADLLEHIQRVGKKICP